MSKYAEQQARLNAFIAAVPEYPAERFAGRGIVICAGGLRYFTNAWVCVNILREHGCKLPVQFWHLGPEEIDDEMRELVRPLGVECVDGRALREKYPARILNGWELKPYAMIHSPFEEVICLDADNVALIDPEKLFETPEYKQTGAIFWPDYGRLAASRSIWEIMEIPYRDEPEFESGQIVVDKRRCWKALQITMHLNEWSDFYYQHIHGDKETFHMAWRKIEQEYSMPVSGIYPLAGTMCQHDFAGERIFQHRNMRKWQLNAKNDSVADFKLEDRCLEFLSDLRQQWSAASRPDNDPATKQLENKLIAQRYYQYVRVGHDFRPIEFLANGVLLAGPNAIETSWGVIGPAGAPTVAIFENDAILCELSPSGGGMLVGKWRKYERMPVVVVPVSRTSAEVVWTAQNGEDAWLNANIKLPDIGVFVEVGVASGVAHSNTLWLEQRGWRGLLVEADARNIDAIKKLRKTPVINCAAASVDGDVRFVQHANPTLSGISRPRNCGQLVTVAGRRLDGLLKEHNFETVDIMSIDTEGTECDVLDGLGDLRPRFLIVEYFTLGADLEDATDARDDLVVVQNKLAQMGYKVIHTTRSNVIAEYAA